MGTFNYWWGWHGEGTLSLYILFHNLDKIGTVINNYCSSYSSLKSRNILLLPGQMWIYQSKEPAAVGLWFCLSVPWSYTFVAPFLAVSPSPPLSSFPEKSNVIRVHFRYATKATTNSKRQLIKLITALVPLLPFLPLPYLVISIMLEEGSGFYQSTTPGDSPQAGPFEKIKIQTSNPIIYNQNRNKIFFNERWFWNILLPQWEYSMVSLHYETITCCFLFLFSLSLKGIILVHNILASLGYLT